MSLALGAGDSHTEGGGTTFASLRESIRANGGVINPVLVNRDPEGRLVTIEGNTRVLIYREFKDQSVPGNWAAIPAVVYDKLSQPDIDAIRLQAHLVGPRPWDPYSKARYLDHLSNRQLLPMSQIVEFCGGRQREVRDYIQAYQEMEQYYRPLLDSDDEFDPTRFSAFVEVQRPRVREAVLAGHTLRNFAEWVRDDRLSPLATVRQLPRILKDAKSREEFLRHGSGAQQALKLLDVPATDDALREAPLDQLAREVFRRINSLPWSELQRLKASPDGADVEILRALRDSVTQLFDQYIDAADE